MSDRDWFPSSGGGGNKSVKLIVSTGTARRQAAHLSARITAIKNRLKNILNRCDTQTVYAKITINCKRQVLASKFRF